MAERDDLLAELEILSAGYAAALPQKLATIEQAWGQLLGDRWNEEGFHELHRLVHSLGGSGKTFGFAKVGDVAHELDLCFKLIAEAKRAPDAEQGRRIRDLLDKLRQAGRQGNGSA